MYLDLLGLVGPLGPVEEHSDLRFLELVQDREGDVSEVRLRDVGQEMRSASTHRPVAWRTVVRLTAIDVVDGVAVRVDTRSPLDRAAVALLEEGESVSCGLNQSVGHGEPEEAGRIGCDGGSDGREIDEVDNGLGSILVGQVDQTVKGAAWNGPQASLTKRFLCALKWLCRTHLFVS